MLDVFRILTRRFFDPTTRYRLLICFIKFFASTLLERNNNQDIIKTRILQYEVHSYGFAQLLSLFREIFINGEYYFAAENDHPAIFDCGANVGVAMIFFNILYPNCCIHAFEPDIRAFTLLDQIQKVNKLKNVKLFNIALSSQEGSVDFYYDSDSPNSLGNSIFFERMPKNKIMVKSARLSSFVGSEQIDFVKLDVEGAESQILDDLARTGALRRIKLLAVEYHHKIGQIKSSLGPFLSLLEMNHFEYQIRASFQERDQFQDIFLYCYQA